MPDATSHLGLYRAGLTSAEHRRRITVARNPLVQDTLEILRGSMSRNSKHHFLFIGPRGIGKTHLLSLIEDEIAAASDLSAHYVVARFPEESHRTLSFADFLLGLCEILSDMLPEEPLWRDLHQRLRTEEEDVTITDTLVPALRRQNRARHRTVLVMLENLGEMFTRQIKKKPDIAALRKFFMDDNGCLLLATAPLHFDAITSVEEPFYDFFDVQILEDLSEAETLELIRRNLEWEQRDDLLQDFDSLRPKLLALYKMTGGNPRLTVMLYELIANDAITEVRQQFQILLDRITPFYQSRLNDLPPQERAVLETMAVMRDQEKTPAAITARMRLSQPQTSSLLKRLTEARYLRSTPHPQDKRSRLYSIREGFFDIWLAMNLSRGARERLPFLLDFFTLYYPSIEEREQKRAKLHGQWGNGDAELASDYLSEVGPPEERAVAKLNLARLHAGQGVLDKTVRYLREASLLPLDPVATWIVRHVDDTPSTDYLNELQEMVACWELHRSGNLEAFAKRFSDLADTLSFKSFSETKISFLRDHLHYLSDTRERIRTRLKIAKLLHDLACWPEAEQELKLAKDEAETLGDSAILAITLNNLAQLLYATNRLAEAEPLMYRALAIDEKSFGSDHPKVAIRLSNLAQLLQATNRLAEAEPLMHRALAIDEKSFGSDHPNVAIRLNNLAGLLQDTNRLAEAEPLIHRALAIDEKSFGSDHPKVAIRLNNLAQLLHATNRLAEAEPLMYRALSVVLDFKRRTGYAHPQLRTVTENYADILQALGRCEADVDVGLRRLLEEYGSL
ncbi:MAG: tetratricopeptide repeat protein [Gammaproteobacteria bacterium]|nr:tetratricopeptide repeat protein [Gammaproteobacteria bacterium]